MNEFTKATDIPPEVKQLVWERDRKRCIVCGSTEAMPNAHVVRRSHGGQGKETNIVTLCRRCHDLYDNGTGEKHDKIRRYIRAYMVYLYGPTWSEKGQIYHRKEE